MSSFRWFKRTPKNPAPPEASFTVETPIEGSGEREISDLFPVFAITASYPVINTTTYGDLSILVEPKPDGDTTTYNDYVLRRIEKVAGSLFARLYFTRNITNPLDEAPFQTVQEFDPDFSWDPILYQVKFLEDRQAPFATAGPNGNTIFTPRYFPRAFYTDAQRGALILTEHFVASSPVECGYLEQPMGTTVSYDFHNVHDTFGKCLHPRLVFDAKQGAFTAYNAATDAAVSVSGSISGQIFEATNFTEWEAYVFSFRVVRKGLLFEVIRQTAVPPELPEISLK